MPPRMTRLEAAEKRGKSQPKPRCQDCFFGQNMLCALNLGKPCPTFRLAHPDGLRPPQQLSFAFRHDRGSHLLGRAIQG
jgi:hypothetical protein